MINKITPVLKLLLKLWKPDIRKTTGWLLVTSGLLLISPNFVQDIILNFLSMHNIVAQESYEHTHSLGTLLITAGINYHLLYLDSISEKRKLETFLMLTLLTLCVVMVYITL